MKEAQVFGASELEILEAKTGLLHAVARGANGTFHQLILAEADG